MWTVEQHKSVSWWEQRRSIQGLSTTCFLEVKVSVLPLVFCGDKASPRRAAFVVLVLAPLQTPPLELLKPKEAGGFF